MTVELDPHWSVGEVDADGVAIHYTRTGHGQRPPLLLAHGFTDTGLCWSRVARALQDRFDVVMIDARNHGRSGTAPGAPPRLTDDVGAVVDGLGLDDVTLMGHSIGARTMASFAVARPAVVRRLILEDPPWRAEVDPADESPERLEKVRAYVRSLGEMSDDELFDLAAAQHGDWDADEYPAWVDGKRMLRPESADSLAFTDWRTLVPRIEAPTLVVRGRSDRGGIVSAEVAAEVVALNGEIDVVAVEAGHNIRRENYPDFMVAVAAALSG